KRVGCQLQHHRVLIQTHVLRLMHQSQHIRLRHANTFWFARRPGGEHHIRQVISTTAPPQVCPAPLPPLSLLSRTYHSHLLPISPPAHRSLPSPSTPTWRPRSATCSRAVPAVPPDPTADKRHQLSRPPADSPSTSPTVPGTRPPPLPIQHPAPLNSAPTGSP